MAGYKIYFKVSVEKDLRQFPQREIKKILQRIDSLTTNPRLPGSEKLTGQERYRVRQGRYRILYSIQDNKLTIWVAKISHRKDVYR
jgi:mRNA interferase RelE/StbE